jgi:hypothetical protein
MAVVLTVNTNSYVDVAAADTYFAERLFAEPWDDATDDNKAKALIMATKTIDRQILRGQKYSADQALQFPRSYPIDFSLIRASWYPGNANWVSESDVPQAVIDACCEEALALLDRGNSTRLKLQKEGVKSASVGSASESYTNSVYVMLSPEARDLMQTYVGSVIVA